LPLAPNKSLLLPVSCWKDFPTMATRDAIIDTGFFRARSAQLR
jgi:hypothetical protein